MGSPSARLKTRESLRPWLESGLEFVYNPGGLPAEEPVQPQVAPQQSQSYRPAQQGQPSPPPQPQQQMQQQQVQQRPVQAQATPQAPPQQPAAPAPNFPAPWNGFLKFAKPTAQVVWTYMELGLDLGGQADQRRSNVLKNLQAHLRWPPGTINFWPCAALNAGALQPDTSMFWRGWELWRTPSIACFGEEALKVILPDADPALKTHMLENVIVYVLPPIAKLMTMLPHEQQLAVDELTKIRV